jgi:hypothetical protein
MKGALHAAVERSSAWSRASSEHCEALGGMATSLNELYKWAAPLACHLRAWAWRGLVPSVAWQPPRQLPLPPAACTAQRRAQPPPRSAPGSGPAAAECG